MGSVREFKKINFFIFLSILILVGCENNREGIVDNTTERNSTIVVDNNITETNTTIVIDDNITETNSTFVIDNNITETNTTVVIDNNITETNTTVVDNNTTETNSTFVVDNNITETNTTVIIENNTTETNSTFVVDNNITETNSTFVVDNNITETNSTVVIDINITGKVIDGEISGATLFLDLNLNDALDSNEPRATTTGDGSFLLILESVHQEDKNYLNQTAPLIAFGGKDIRTNEPFEDYLMSMTEGKLTVNITPFSTLIAQSITQEVSKKLSKRLNKSSEEVLNDLQQKIEVIKDNLARLFGISKELLTEDPIALAKSGNNRLLNSSLQIHKTSKSMKKAMKKEVRDLEKSILSGYRALGEELKKLDRETVLNSGENIVSKALESAMKSSELFDGNLVEVVTKETKSLIKEIDTFWKNRENRVLDDNAVDDIIKDMELHIMNIDSTKPIITLIGDATVNLLKDRVYSDAGATANDDRDGDISSNIQVNNLVNVNSVGRYSITYNVNDQAGNQAVQVSREVIVSSPPPPPPPTIIKDTTNPVIIVIGDSNLTILKDTLYSDLGAIASDNIDGDISNNIVINNRVDTTVVGVYTITYDINDTAGNQAVQVSRIVNVVLPTLEKVSNEEWNSLSVRKVLKTFAYGGHATDSQIEIWANMSPSQSVEEILNFDTQNSKLSPPQADENLSNLKTLTDVGNFIYAKRENSIYFDPNWQTPTDSSLWRNWGASVLLRGLNPFISKIGLWESNYHLSANQQQIYYSNILYAYYDDIIAEHQKSSSYDNVMAKASWSHAIAKQYGFSNTRYSSSSDKFYDLNEDFGREFHQLFFVNMGEYNPSYHEETTIKNTAKALTGLINCYKDGKFLPRCEADSSGHYQNDLEILNSQVSGSDISEKMTNLSAISMAHQESLENLPVYIVSSLADDNMDDNTTQRIINSWKALESKNLLEFIQNYAISTSFHSENRIKYQSSIDRTVTFWNRLTTENQAIYLNGFSHYFIEGVEYERVVPFYLKHNVFGHQTGIESVNSAYSIASTISSRIEQYDFFCRSIGWKDNEVVYIKKWSSTIPSNSNTEYTKEYVVKWLWNALVADNFKNYGVLERSHLLAMISGKDLGYLLDANNPTKVYSIEELKTNEIEEKINILAEELIDVDDSAYNVNRAMTFIGATPFVFIEEGK